MLSNSLSRFDVLTKATVTDENRVIIDLRTVKDSYENMEIKNVAFILSEHNISDPLTKINNNITIIIALRFSTLSNSIQQLVIRNKVNDEKIIRDGSVDKAGNVGKLENVP